MASPLEVEFEAAVEYISKLPTDGPYKPTDDSRLKFYGYFKQVRVGPCNTPKPGVLSPIERAKWSAWDKLGQMSKEEAMKEYLTEFKKVKAEAEAKK